MHEKKRVRKLLQNSLDEQRHEMCRSLTKYMALEEVLHLGIEGVQHRIHQKLMEFKSS